MTKRSRKRKKQQSLPRFERYAEETSSSAEHEDIVSWTRFQGFHSTTNRNSHQITWDVGQLFVKEID